MSGGVLKHHPVPRYALVDMNKHAEDLLAFIDQNVGRYIVGAVGTADVLLWETYWMAFRQSREVKVSEPLTINTSTGAKLNNQEGRLNGNEMSSKTSSVFGSPSTRRATPTTSLAKKSSAHRLLTTQRAHGMAKYQCPLS